MEELLLWKQRYIHHLELEKGLSGHSLRAIQGDLKHFLNALLQENFQGRMTVYHVKYYIFHLQEEAFSTRTIQRKISSLKGFLRFLREQSVQEEDVSLYLSTWKSEEESFHAFSKQDWKRFRESFQENVRERAIFELLYSSGLTPKEFLSLSYLQLDWERQEIYLLEKGKTRKTFFSKKAKEALQEYSQKEGIQEGFLWDFSEKTLRNILARYKQKGEISPLTTIYSFRHSFAVHLLEAGMSKIELQYLLGLDQGERLLQYEAYIEKER